MKILVLDEEFPYPANTGKRIRSFNLIKRLAVNHQVTYLAYGDTDSESFHRLKSAGINPVAIPNQVPKKSGPLFYFRLLANLFNKLPYMVVSHYSKQFQGALDDIILEFKPEIIICEWTPYAIFVKNIKHITKMIAAHNVEARIWQRYYENESNPLKKWYTRIQWEKVQIFERDAFHWVEGATAVSSIDADEIHSFNHRLKVKAVDNGVDLEYFKPSGNEAKPDNIVFVGTMDWRPNQDAVLYFCDRIFPLIKKSRPNAEAYFVGRKAPEHIMALNKIAGITVTGAVEDVRPYIDDGTVYVVPLRIGGGTRLKILDALAMKKAVVSTSVGAEGLAVTDGENIILADSPENFAERVVSLFDNKELRKRLGEGGRMLVESKYGWDSIAARLEQFLLELAE